MANLILIFSLALTSTMGLPQKPPANMDQIDFHGTDLSQVRKADRENILLANNN